MTDKYKQIQDKIQNCHDQIVHTQKLLHSHITDENSRFWIRTKLEDTRQQLTIILYQLAHW